MSWQNRETHWLEAEGKGLSLEFFGLTWVRKGVYISYTLILPILLHKSRLLRSLAGRNRMAYESDFYVPENIVGYTGDIDQKPTVYFKREDTDGTTTFGHITQNWFDGTFGKSNSPNVGREVLRNADDYTIGNVRGAMLEQAPSINFQHSSRSMITLLDRTTKAKTRYKLGLAIANFTCQKHWERLTEDEKEQFRDGAQYLHSKN